MYASRWAKSSVHMQQFFKDLAEIKAEDGKSMIESVFGSCIHLLVYTDIQ